MTGSLERWAEQKNVMHSTRFSESLARSNSLSPDTVARLLRENGVRHVRYVTRRPSVAQDRLGIDYIAYRENGLRPLFVDLKETSYRPGKSPCVLLETACHGRSEKPGWATDSAKKTDLFLITYGDGSALVLSARQVRAALEKHGATWASEYRTGYSATRGFYETYHTEYVLVPYDVLKSACEDAAAAWRQEAAGAKAARDDENLRQWYIARIKATCLELNRTDTWQYDRMSIAELRHVDESLVDEIVSCGWQSFPTAPFPGLPGWLVPLTDYAMLKHDEHEMDNCARCYVRRILAGLSYVYSVLLPERATLIVSRPATDARWQVTTLLAREDSSVRRETRGLVEGWMAARAGFERPQKN